MRRGAYRDRQRRGGGAVRIGSAVGQIGLAGNLSQVDKHPLIEVPEAVHLRVRWEEAAPAYLRRHGRYPQLAVGPVHRVPVHRVQAVGRLACLVPVPSGVHSALVRSNIGHVRAVGRGSAGPTPRVQVQ